MQRHKSGCSWAPGHEELSLTPTHTDRSAYPTVALFSYNFGDYRNELSQYAPSSVGKLPPRLERVHEQIVSERSPHTHAVHCCRARLP